MTTDAARFEDMVKVELNGQDVSAGPKLPPRPPPHSNKATWMAYAVALGLSPETILEDYTREELLELVQRFGG